MDVGDDFDLTLQVYFCIIKESTFKCKFEDFYSDEPDGKLHKQKQKQFIDNLLLEVNKIEEILIEQMDKTRRQDQGDLKEKVELSSTPKGPWTYDFSVRDLSDSLKEYFEYTPDEEERKHEYGFFRAIQQCIDSAEKIMDREIEPYDIDHVWLANWECSVTVD